MTVQAGKEQRLGTRRKRPDVLSIIGLFFVGLVAIWLLVNFIDDPESFVNVSLIGLTTGSSTRSSHWATRSSTASCS